MASYFTCTLGEAALMGKEEYTAYQTIPALLAAQARESPDLLAVGFPTNGDSTSGNSPSQCFTFSELYEKVLDVADILIRDMRLQPGQTVGLLASSGRDFLFCWLALVCTGCTVLLVAPEVTAEGIAGLCHSTETSLLLCDEKHTRQAEKAAEILAATTSRSCAVSRLPVFPTTSSPVRQLPLRRVSAVDVAYVHHTSGTSTGFPKPIRISHHGAIAVVPVLPRSNHAATFSTTPLYHGGPADCFRAWASGAMIWLFPGVEDVPITAKNVVQALNSAEILASDSNNPKRPLARYFTAVPYVVELLASNPEGLKWLKMMYIVATGGASFPSVLGNNLMSERVNLISRYGSAECGFILGSDRDYAVDREWQYLRAYTNSWMQFESTFDGKAELVLKDWPFMAKADDNNQYRTGDLFLQHDNIPYMWKHVGRSDAMMTLSSGLKFDPAPIENELLDKTRSLGLIQDLFIFGEGRLTPGLFLIRSDGIPSTNDGEVIEAVWPHIQSSNEKLPQQARLSKHMVVLLASDSIPLKKSSKGTLLRGQIKQDYKDLINDAYHRKPPVSTQPMEYGAICQNVYRIVKQHMIGGAMYTEIPVDTKLHTLGADSATVLAIQSQLQRDYGQVTGHVITIDDVYNFGVEGLAAHILNQYTGEGTRERVNAYEQMEQFFRAYRYEPAEEASPEPHKPHQNGTKPHQSSESAGGEVVLLTGVTGTLGVWIFHLLRFSSTISEIHCLIRATDSHAAEQRLTKALAHKHLPPHQESKTKVFWHPCKLADSPSLGLPAATLTHLTETTTLIIHVAWAVNFNLPLSNFDSHLSSLRNLLDFATSSPQPSPPKFLFCSSTASVLGPHIASFPQTRENAAHIEESIYESPDSASQIGYAQSKLVAERICNSAHFHTRLRNRIAVLRIGQLCGDDKSGVWNVTEAWPLMLSSVRVTGALPDLGEKEKLGWLKVDSAARAVCEVGFADFGGGLEDGLGIGVGVGEKRKRKRKGDEEEGERGQRDEEKEQANGDGCQVYHVINTNTSSTWSDLLQWMNEIKPNLEILPPAQWVQRLEGLEGKAKEHPARKLLGLWKTAYCREKMSEEEGKEGGEEKEIVYDMEKTLQVAPTLGNVEPIEKAYFGRIWRWVEEQEQVDGG
ncbi:putative NRPS-like protein biosynthetic cluster [Bacidia gigantensis]|uniref:putative NRPS-like protein biosynthetic cluster n=1 Tax=Bacidia gigantensis TaxID=2732470 RepID=UPI001D03A065|nr:putative NRPS-like protein biosynthetic cluster [Bacidia gigantensis]KAG8532232.1 putative NRPS-like protein biosynthetic cluster [Bacidia gigantensis]